MIYIKKRSEIKEFWNSSVVITRSVCKEIVWETIMDDGTQEII